MFACPCSSGPAGLAKRSAPGRILFLVWFLVLSVLLVTGNNVSLVEAKKRNVTKKYFGTLESTGPNSYRCSPQEVAEEVVGAVVLSVKAPEMSIECREGGEFMPLDGAKRYPRVCSVSATDKTDCDRNSQLLTEYLPKAQDLWYTETFVDDNATYKFKIPSDGFPPQKQQFKVGCRYTGNEYCFITVTVEPAAAVVTRQKATCGYSEAEPVNLELSMSEDNNSIAIQCGENHFPQPSTYSLQYCSGQSVDPQHCVAQHMTKLFTNFSTKWWKGKPNSPAGTVFTIPEGEFPTKPTTFLVGCSSTVDAGPFCNVRVNVAARSQEAVGAERPSGTLVSSASAPGIAFLSLVIVVGLHTVA
ncbi:SRS domain-containing protein [Neospora caninum Liverpool]|uniref:SRS domain-containing protein n=1 Tax=Neospora caninum (strain Liverpool) TaxID=572307 RepID=F0VPJ5_NEOCL|nr:SRS domain-containing protein [Neospora caninum Liverpool]CBZ55641.1 SRS domain-containing protein [Neospora caninum Liverpool]CEL70383.1 TPA: SRS domain-containing protein [Neospora caninum Liverpool]|eukprot:XP_003885669.1 SRS domain-containing protein [Neospora caninum Liverpool]